MNSSIFTEISPGVFSFQGKTAFQKSGNKISIKLKNIHKFPHPIQRSLLEFNGSDIKFETTDGTLEIPSWLAHNYDAYALKLATNNDFKIALTTEQLRSVVQVYNKIIKGEVLSFDELQIVNLVDLDLPSRLDHSYTPDISLLAGRGTLQMDMYLAFAGILGGIVSPNLPTWKPEPGKPIQDRTKEYSSEINKITRGRVWTTGTRCGGEIFVQPGHPLFGKTREQMNGTPIRAHLQWVVGERVEDGNWIFKWDYQDGEPSEYQPKNQRRTLDSLTQDLDRVVSVIDSVRSFEKLFFIGHMLELLSANEKFMEDYGTAIVRTMEI